MKSFNDWLQEKQEKKQEDPLPCLSDVAVQMYNSIRKPTHNYEENLIDKEKDNFEDSFKEKNGYITARCEDGWCFRVNEKPVSKKKEIKERYSLNVRPDVNLLKALDDFMEENSENIDSYKGAANALYWDERHDSVTIYCYEATKEMSRNLVEITKPFIRKGAEKQPIVGEILSTGITFDKNPTSDMVEDLMKKARKSSGDLFNEVFADQVRPIDNAMSSGSYYVANTLLDSFIKNKDNIYPQSIKYYKNWSRGKISDGVYKRLLHGLKHRKESPFNILKLGFFKNKIR